MSPDPSNDALHAAFLANREAVANVSGDGAVARIDGWHLYDSATGLAQLNQAMVEDGSATPGLTTVAGWYGVRGADYCLVLRDPEDSAVIGAAGGAGFVRARSQPVMVRALPCEVSRREGLTVREVRTAVDALEFLAVRREPGKERPPEGPESEFMARLIASGRFKYFVAGTPAGPVGTVTSVAAGGIVVVANVFVLPSLRRQGIGAALTAHAANAWPGTTHVALEASREGALLYESMGFEKRYRYVRLLPRQSALAVRS